MIGVFSSWLAIASSKSAVKVAGENYSRLLIKLPLQI